VWFGVVLTLTVAIGQFTPPMAVNLMVSSKIAGVRIEQTTRWVLWFVFAMTLAMLLVVAFPQLALWLPAKLGY
jgi:C4-dicarboxylate transporter DctM subunit